MDNFEKVEKLVEKTGITYEEAKEVLESTNYDILDAMIELEKRGRIEKPSVESFNTDSKKDASEEFEKTQKEYEQNCSQSSFGQMMNQFIDLCGKILNKTIETQFEVRRDGKVIIDVPLIVLIIVLIFAFWIAVPLLIIGLFVRCQYRFKGDTEINVDLNGVNENTDSKNE